MKKIIYIFLSITYGYIYPAKLLVTNMSSNAPIMFDFVSEGKRERTPIKINKGFSHMIKGGPHGIDAVSWTYEPVQDPTTKEFIVDNKTYAVEIQVSPIRARGKLMIRNKGDYWYSRDKRDLRNLNESAPWRLAARGQAPHA